LGSEPSRPRPRSPRGRARETTARLALEYPEYEVPLDHESAFQLLVATILSAQCTDAMVNRVTPELFARYPTAAEMALADAADVEQLIHATGFFRQKTRSLIGMAGAVVEHFDGEVPSSMDDLTSLPGVGRKTAHVIRGHWFGLPAITVDTHVLRLSGLLGLTESDDPVKVERDLAQLWRKVDWTDSSMRMIFHGRAVCIAWRPRCEECVLADFCPSAR
jgi:endonuclease-3